MLRRCECATLRRPGVVITHRHASQSVQSAAGAASRTEVRERVRERERIIRKKRP